MRPRKNFPGTLLSRNKYKVKYEQVVPLIKDYLGTKSQDPSYVRSTIRHFEDRFAGVRIEDVNQELIDDYIEGEIAAGHQQSTAVRRLNVLRAAIHWGVRKHHVLKGDVFAWRAGAKNRRRERALTRGEVARLLWAARKLRKNGKLAWLEIWLWISIYTGARPSATRELPWRRVDLQHKAIDFRNGKETTKRRGVVPISKALFPVIARAKREATSQYVVNHIGGSYPSARGLGDAFKRLVDPLALGGEGLDAVSPYTMRHTAASLMLRGGANAWATAGVLKISVQRLTSVYAKHFDDHLREAVDKL